MKALEEFEDPGGRVGLLHHPQSPKSWRRNWRHVVPFFAYRKNVRRIIYPKRDQALNSNCGAAVHPPISRMTTPPSGCYVTVLNNFAAEE